MQYDEFIGQVQHRARLANSEQAVRATRATLETLGRRLFGGEMAHVRSQLPPEFQPLFEAGSEGPLKA